jgi:AraC-like DNA-binding protein
MAAEPFARFPIARTSDFDVAQAAMQSTFLPLRMRVVGGDENAGRFDLGLNATHVGRVTVSYVQVGRSVRVQTTEAENFHVNLPVTGGTRSRSGHLEQVESTPDRAAVFMPGLPADIEWHGGCGQFCLMFPRHVLEQELEAMLDRPLSAPLAFDPAMDVVANRGRAWADTVRLVETQAQQEHSLLDHPLAAGNVQRLLVDGLLLGQSHNYSDELAGHRRPAAAPAVHQAIDLLRECPEQPWTTASLARRVAVSARSLQDGFARAVGIPPMRYLREVRLQRVHEELTAGDPHTTTVSQVAGRWGALDLSRLAAAYRRKFGESPSQTLRG